MADKWSQHARLYDQHFAPPLSLFAHDALVLAKSRTPSTARVLDVACGSGAMTVHLVKLGHQVTATDWSQGMLDRVRSLNLPLVDLVQGDGQTLEGFPGDHFDAVTSSFGIFLFPDREAGWRAALRVLKRGGLLITLAWAKESLNIEMIRHLAKIASPDAQPSPPNPCSNLDTFKAEVESCGFVNANMYSTTHEFVFESGKVFVDAMLDNPFVAMYLEHISSERALELLAGFFGKSSREFADSPLCFPGKATICIAEKPL